MKRSVSVVALVAAVITQSAAWAQEESRVVGVRVFECGSRGSDHIDIAIAPARAPETMNVVFHDFSYGLSVAGPDGEVFSDEWPGAGTVYVSSDQNYLQCIRVFGVMEHSPYMFSVWAQDSGKRFTDSLLLPAMVALSEQIDEPPASAVVSVQEMESEVFTAEDSSVTRATDLGVTLELAVEGSPDEDPEEEIREVFSYRTLDSAIAAVEEDILSVVEEPSGGLYEAIKALSRRVVQFLRSLV